MSVELRLDSDGDIWLVHDDGDDVRSALLGPVDDPRTGYSVPDELLNELGRLEVAWAEAVGFRTASRDEAIDCYRRNSL